EFADTLAAALAGRGILRGDYVPILMDRGMELVIAFLAVMKTGAAFVPLDGYWPVERLKQLLGDLDSEVILVSRATPQQESELQRVFVRVDLQTLPGSTSGPGVRVHPDDPIYAFYTSGSTGTPKAAIVAHRGITNRFM